MTANLPVKGERFGEWIATGNYEVRRYGNRQKPCMSFEVQCKCGVVKMRQVADLRGPKGNSCAKCFGVKNRKQVEHPNKGDTFGQWTYTGNKVHDKLWKYECSCSCGKTIQFLDRRSLINDLYQLAI